MTSLRLFATLGTIFLLGTIFYLLEGVLVPFVAAWVLAYLLVPPVDLLGRRMPRWAAIFVVFAALLLVLGLVFFGLVPVLQDQVNAFLGQLPTYMEHIAIMAHGVAQHLHLNINSKELTLQFEDKLSALGSKLVQGPAAVLNTAATTVKVTVFVALVPIVAFYLLRDWHRLSAGLESFARRGPDRRRMQRVLRISDEVLRHFIHGELLVMVGVALMYTIGYAVTGVTLGLVLGILAGVVFVIPFASFVISGIPAFLLALVQFHDLTHPAMVAATIAFSELIGNTILTPVLVGRFVQIHPALVLLSIFAGGALFGVLGMVLALPLAAIVTASWQELRDPRFPAP